MISWPSPPAAAISFNLLMSADSLPVLDGPFPAAADPDFPRELPFPAALFSWVDFVAFAGGFFASFAFPSLASRSSASAALPFTADDLPLPLFEPPSAATPFLSSFPLLFASFVAAPLVVAFFAADVLVADAFFAF